MRDCFVTLAMTNPMTASDIINKYIQFFEKRGHTRIENSSLVPLNDPTTLFTSSGMQPLVPYLLGESHPAGRRLVNVQNSFRAQDIEEIGDNRHTTFFRMLGNWSLGDYFKKEQIPWFFEFLTKELQLDPQKLYVTVFEGSAEVSADSESIEIWKNEFKKVGVDAEVGTRIFKYGVNKNWWSRAGVPANMPVGEPGGPDTEVFYDLETPHDPKFGESCHVNCDCGRYLEIGNSVFMQYMKTSSNFQELPQKNVDFGGGLERLVLVTEGKTDIFETSLFSPVIKRIEGISSQDYSSNMRAMRIIADHLIASVFIIANKVVPSNKEQGYVLRRLIRRAIRYGKQLGIEEFFAAKVAEAVIEGYSDTDSYLLDDKQLISDVLREEEKKFSRVIDEGLKQSEKIFSKLTPIDEKEYTRFMQIPDKKEIFRSIYRGGNIPNLQSHGVSLTPSQIASGTVTGQNAFNLYQSFGFPAEMIVDLAQEKKIFVDIEATRDEIKKHQEQSRSGSAQKFAGGLADHSEKTIMGHTATHLMHQALRDMFGTDLHQTGSNITSERVRFDFNFDRKLTQDELDSLQKTVNDKIQENLPVHFEMMPVARAKELGAIGLFDEKYAEIVKVYFIGGPESSSGQSRSSFYSIELCGGPHVNFTGDVKRFTIVKQESLGRGMQRIYSQVG